MAGNVHKDEVSAVKIPSLASLEDRGLSRCAKPIKVLATLTSTERHKNDLTGIAVIADTLTVELEDESGTLTTAPGISVSFPYQSNASGFVIDWRQVTRNGGLEIATGCYKVKVSGTISGISFTYYYAAFDLNVWSMQLARNTVQVFSVLNDLVRKDGINYKDSGFCNSVRFQGSFGYMQPNYQTTNLTYTDRTRKKVNNEALRTYELRTSYLLGCLTEMIDEQHLLAANNIWITEHNPLAHIQYIEFPVIVDEDTSPSLEYPPGVYAKLTAVFKDKVAVHQSKYDGNIQANENVSFNLPQGLVCPTITTSSNNRLTIKTGQTTIYQTDDDGDLKFGAQTNWTTLSSANPFGNNSRFTDLVGTSIYSDGVVLDWNNSSDEDELVVGWQLADNGVNIDWSNAITYCTGLTLAGYSGWNLPNDNLLYSLKYTQGLRALDYPPFNDASNVRFWSSTTPSGILPTQACILANQWYGVPGAALKTTTSGYRARAYRIFTYAELGL